MSAELYKRRARRTFSCLPEKGLAKQFYSEENPSLRLQILYLYLFLNKFLLDYFTLMITH